MNRTIKPFLRAVIGAFAVSALLTVPAQAEIITSTIPLGPPNTGTFSATLSAAPGSSVYLGSASGNFRQFIARVFGVNQYANISLSASNQTTGLNIGTSTISTNNSSGTASLTYDNITPGTPITLNSFNANLSDGATAPVTMSTTSPINVNSSLGTLPLSMQLQNGTISGVTFTSSGSSPDDGTFGIPGTLSAKLNGNIRGFIVLPLGLGSLDIGNLYTLSNVPITIPVPGLLGATILSDTGVPSGLNPTAANPNTMLARFLLAANSATFPVAVSLPLALNYSNPLPNNGTSGLTSLVIGPGANGPSTFNANLLLSNLQYELSGKVPNVLVPEPSSIVLGSLALVIVSAVGLRRRRMV